MNRRIFELSLDRTDRYISNVLAFSRFAHGKLKSNDPDVCKPYWKNVIYDNRVMLKTLKQYRHLLFLRG